MHSAEALVEYLTKKGRPEQVVFTRPGRATVVTTELLLSSANSGIYHIRRIREGKETALINGL